MGTSLTRFPGQGLYFFKDMLALDAGDAFQARLW
jgi:hypothetical protein